METMTVDATEKRLDELSKRMDQGFAMVDKRMDLGFEQTNGRLGRLEEDIREVRTEMNSGFEATDAKIAAMDAKFDAKFDRLNRTIIYLLGGSLSILTGGLLAGIIHALF